MAFIDDHHAVIMNPWLDLVRAAHGLQHGNIDNPVAGISVCAIAADDFPFLLSPSAPWLRRQDFNNSKKLRQPLFPLFHQLRAVYKDQRADLFFCNHGCTDHSFAKGSRCRQNAGIMGRQSLECCSLLVPQFSIERGANTASAAALIVEFNGNAVFLHPVHNVVEAAAREKEKIPTIFCAADHAWEVPNRHAHGLTAIKLRISESGDALELILSAVGKAFDGNIQPVRQRDYNF